MKRYEAYEADLAKRRIAALAEVESAARENRPADLNKVACLLPENPEWSRYHKRTK